MLTMEDTKSLLQSLKYNEEDQFIKNILLGNLAKYNTKNSITILNTLEENYSLSNSQIIQELKADSNFYHYNVSECYNITKDILNKDPYHIDNDTFLLHISALVELKMKNELFLWAHQISESFPNSYKANYAIGAYYYCIADYDKARTYFR